MIRLLPTNQAFIPLPESFLFHSMTKMSSSVIKIYLWILYQFHHQYETLNFDEIADHLNLTESDIHRAIKHLTKEGLLRSEYDDENLITLALGDSLPAQKEKNDKSAELTSASVAKRRFKPVPEDTESGAIADRVHSSDAANKVGTRPVYSSSQIESFLQDKEGDTLVFYTKSLFQKQLTANDLQILFSLRDWLEMSYDLIYFLIDYCAETEHTHFNYLEKIAINWHENHIQTVEQAKDYLSQYPSHYYTVLKAYGIFNLAPIPAQIKMIDKWMKEYRFPLDTILYACERTILQTGKPELNYTDSILKAWKEKKLLTKEQILASAEKASKKNTAPKKETPMKTTPFNHYEQRDEDYRSIEKRAVEMLMKKELS